MRKSLGIILTLTATLSGSLLVQLRSNPSLPWSRQYEAALQRASEHRQPLLVYLYTDWCTYCAAMERDTFSDPTLIAEMGPRFQWVKLNSELDPVGIRLREENGVVNYPTLFLLNSEAREIDRLSGFMAPEKFRKQVDLYLYGPTSLLALQRAVSEDPGAVKAHFSLGQKFLSRGDFAAAIEHFSEVLELDSENHHQVSDAALYYMAQSQASSGRQQQALELAGQLETRFPDSGFLPDSAILVGRIHYYGGAKEEALATFKRYLERFEDHHSYAWVVQLASEIDQEIQLSAAAHSR